MKKILLSILLLMSAETHFADEMDNPDKPLDATVKKESWEKMKKVALVVGVNKYRKPISDLTYPDKDSGKIAKALLSVEDYEVILMNDEVGKEKPELLPTFANVTKKWKELTNGKPGLLLFYFSGHGFQDEKKGNAIALADTEVVADDKTPEAKKEKRIKDVKNLLVIGDLISGKHGKADRTVFFIDACREKVSFVEGSKNLTAEKFGKFSEELWKAKGTWMLLSTAPEELSYEYSNLESGLFTHYLEAALTGGIQNESSEEYVTLASLEKYLTRKMEYFNEAQKGTGFYKEEPQKPFLVGEKADLLISTKRPTDSSRVEEYSFRDILDYPIQAKLVFDQYGRRITQRFYEYEDGKPKDKALDGIGAMEYQYKGDNGEKFVAAQIQTNKTKEFVNGLWEEEGKGWEYKAPRKIENSLSREYVRKKFDYNGNLILEESFRVDKNESTDTKNKQTGAATLYTTEEGIATKVYAFDINGKETLKEFYDTQGQLKNDKEGIARYVSAYDTKGNLLLKEYYNQDGNLYPNREGIARITNRYSYKFPDKKGRILQKDYRNAKAELDGDKDGVAIIRYEYTPAGLLKKQEFLDASGNLKDAEIWVSPDGEIAVIPDGESNEKPVENSIKVKVAKMEKEVEGELVKAVSFYRQNGKLKFFRDGGIARIEYKYDKFGNKIETTYFSEGKTRVADKDGISKIVKSFDENCLEKTANNKVACVNLKAFYDATDAIVADEAGYGKQEFKYDSLGNQIYEAYYDAIGNLKENPLYDTPVAIQEREFDAKCLEAGQSYLQCYKLLQMKGADGNLKEDKWGIAKYTAEFSLEGKVIKREYFDKSGKLKNHNENKYAKEAYEYDKDGHLASMSFYTEDDKLVGDTANYSYMEDGNVKTIFYTSDKKQKAEREGIHSVVYGYEEDKDGLRISKEYRDANGNPVELDEFWKTIEKRVEAKGTYTLEQEFFGKDTKRKPKEGFAKVYRKWNFENQILEEEKYDTQASLREASKWNKQNRLIEQRFEDGKKNLVLNPEKKYARMSAKYTDDSVLLEQRFFGADNKPIVSGSYATFTAKYDDKKRLLLKETLDADNNPIPDSSGTAKQEYYPLELV